MSTAENRPVAMVHGFAGSFDSTWENPGVAQLVRDIGRPVIGVDLLGHGTAPKPHEQDTSMLTQLDSRWGQSHCLARS
jgi:pimeloyl-ACP methyl ester carboxylesterase